MKTENKFVAKLKEIGQLFKKAHTKAFMGFGMTLLLGMQAQAAGNPIFQILQSPMAASLVKWVCVPLGIVSFVEALIGAIGGNGGNFLGKVLTAIVLVGIGIYFEDLIGAFASFNGG